MKTFLIVILSIGLAASAYFTRPSEAEFRLFLRQKVENQSRNAFSRFFGQVSFDQTLEQYTFKDRLLWVAVEKGGQTVYAGAFSYWFAKDAAPEKTPLPNS